MRPRTSNSRDALSRCLGLCCVAALGALPARAIPPDPDPSPTLEAVSPQTLAPDDSFTITGSGFTSDPSQYLAYFRGPDAWAPVRIDSVTDTEIRAHLESYAEGFIGDLWVVKGVRYELPPEVIEIGDRAYFVDHASWFHSSGTATLGPVELAPPTQPANGSSSIASEIFIHIDTECLSHSIGCDILLEGEFDIDLGGEPWLMHAEVDLMVADRPSPGNTGPRSSLDDATLTADLAIVFDRLFGRFGLAASAGGNLLGFTHSLPLEGGGCQISFD